MDSQAVVAFGKPLQSVHVDTPVPKGTEVLVKVHHCGVCHSDIHLHDGCFDLGGGNKLDLSKGMSLPHTLGHEIEGEVVALGPDASGVAIGARRAVFPWIGCGKCPNCERGLENMCNRGRSLGCAPGVNGGYATHVLVPHPRYLLDYGKTPPALAAAYMCSGITAFAALKKVGKVSADEPVLILGCGGVGMMGIEFAEAVTGQKPLVADIDDGRLEAALKAGGKVAYNTKDPKAVERVRADTRDGVYAVIDFVGSEATQKFAQAVLRKGGRIVIVGLFGGGMTIPIPLFPFQSMAIQGSMTGTLKEAEQMMELVRAGRIGAIPIELRPLARASATLDDMRAGRITGRVVLTP
ncbi:MAG: alcohol dehydrogenase catalytic domain-containing protein [Alphaproteobacteria bacterium]|nr:alcohol dehydrogenase catalytic domain-containing protein [Alphaproteobacteria bacterium]